MYRYWDGRNMNHHFWPTGHPAAFLLLVAAAILVFAWPAENVFACVTAALMMVVAAGIITQRHLRLARIA
jgi:hypothetical protein